MKSTLLRVIQGRPVAKAGIAIALVAVICSACYIGNPDGQKTAIAGDSITAYSEGEIINTLTPSYDIDIQADPGKTISYLEPEIKKELLENPSGPPQNIVINLGTNDILHDNLKWASDWSNLMTEVSHVPCIVLVTINTWVDLYNSDPTGTTAEDINQAIAFSQAADPSQIHVIDWNNAVHTIPGLLLGDLIHPTAAGAQWLASNMLSTLQTDCS